MNLLYPIFKPQIPKFNRADYAPATPVAQTPAKRAESISWQLGIKGVGAYIVALEQRCAALEEKIEKLERKGKR
jgi:hypothetical protein